MKKILVTAIILISSFSIRATNIALNDIKDSIVSFLVHVEHINEDLFKMIPDDLFNNNIRELRIHKSIANGMNGIFLLDAGTHNASHFLLIEDNDFQIINMRGSFTDNLKILLNFLEKNDEYTKDDAIFYSKAFVRINESNLNIQESMRSYKDYIPDIETAEKIAETVWLKMYGPGILLQKPYTGKLENGIWHIEGNADYLIKNKMLGGVAYIQIRKTDGKILDVFHTK